MKLNQEQQTGILSKQDMVRREVTKALANQFSADEMQACYEASGLTPALFAME